MPGIEKPAPMVKPDLPVINGRPDQVFVVQMEDGAENGRWEDIATVTIPANTPRRIALKQALEGVEITPGESPVRLRALDAKSAEVHEPEAHQPPLEWKL